MNNIFWGSLLNHPGSACGSCARKTNTLSRSPLPADNRLQSASSRCSRTTQQVLPRPKHVCAITSSKSPPRRHLTGGPGAPVGRRLTTVSIAHSGLSVGPLCSRCRPYRRRPAPAPEPRTVLPCRLSTTRLRS